MPHDRRWLLLTCLLAGLLIEAPIVLLFFDASRGDSQSPGYIALLLFHVPSTLAILLVLIPLPSHCSRSVFDAIYWGGTFVIQSGVLAGALFGILTLKKRQEAGGAVGESPEFTGEGSPRQPAVEELLLRTRRGLLIRSLLWGAVIETPLFAWFVSIKIRTTHNSSRCRSTT